MAERCSAYENGKRCRKTKDLTNTLISIVRTEHFVAKLPEKALVRLCPSHLTLSPLEHLMMTDRKRHA